jgi:hypothetical protein
MGARLEAIYNLIDGFIVITRIEDQNAPHYNVPESVLIEPAEILESVWGHLHSQGTELAKADPDTCSKQLGGSISATEGMRPDRLLAMRSFLNYHFVQLPPNERAMGIIWHCLYPHGMWQGNMPPWDDRVTFGVGHWYAALSVDQSGS